MSVNIFPNTNMQSGIMMKILHKVLIGRFINKMAIYFSALQQIIQLHKLHLASLHATYLLLQRTAQIQASNRVYESDLSELDLWGSDSHILGRCLGTGKIFTNIINILVTIYIFQR
jgi:hypothetical protein